MITDRQVPSRGLTIKFIKDATNAPMVHVDEGGHFVDEHWENQDLIDPMDTNHALVSGIVEHKSNKTYMFPGVSSQMAFRHHQVALILSGEMVVQDVDTGAIYRAKEGSLFYWGPGLRIRIGGFFKAFFVQTPVLRKYVRTPEGKKKSIYLAEPIEGEADLYYPGSPPDEVSSEPLLEV